MKARASSRACGLAAGIADSWRASAKRSVLGRRREEPVVTDAMNVSPSRAMVRLPARASARTRTRTLSPSMATDRSLPMAVPLGQKYVAVLRAHAHRTHKLPLLNCLLPLADLKKRLSKEKPCITCGVLGLEIDAS